MPLDSEGSRNLFFKVRKHLNMVSSGKKYSRKSGKPSMEDQFTRAYDFETEEKKDLSGSEEDVIEGAVHLMLGSDVLQLICFEPIKDYRTT